MGKRSWRAAAKVGGAVFFATAGLTPLKAFGGIVLNAAGDAGVREETPETAFGAGSLSTTGTVTELAVRSGSGQNRVSLVKFDLTGLTLADIGGAADLKLHARNAWITGAGGVRVFGLQPGAAQANWSEQTVMYRDAGEAQPVPVNAHPGSQPSVSGLTPGVNAPPAPFIVTTPNTWGADPSAATRAPGLAHETPPYSAFVDSENQARYSRNQQRHAGTLTGAYEAYINQPGYALTAATGNYTDVTSLPVTTFNDLDSSPAAPVGSLTRFIGFLDFAAQSAASRPQGFEFSFTQSADPAMGALNGTNNASLVQYLTDMINAGATSATFLIASKLTGDAGPVTGSQMLFASKDFEVTAGAGAVNGPQLALNVPEPTAFALFGAATLVTASRRRRRA
jgi:hypothetical protein